MAVARITEIIGSSEKSWDDAVQNALDRANQTLRGLTGRKFLEAGLWTATDLNSP